MNFYNAAADETDMQTSTQVNNYLHFVMAIGERCHVEIYVRLAWGQ